MLLLVFKKNKLIHIKNMQYSFPKLMTASNIQFQAAWLHTNSVNVNLSDHAVKVCIWICWIVSTVLANEQLRAAENHTHVGLD